MMPFNSKDIYAQNVNVGGFLLSSKLAKEIDNYESYVVPEDVNLPAVKGNAASVENQYVFYGSNSSDPQIGDVRVKFEVVLPQMVSTIAKQNNNKLGPFVTSNGGQIELLHVGEHSSQQMFEQEQTNNTIITWALRVGGFLMMFFGLSLMLKPLSVITDVIPFIGNLVELGTTVVAVVIAAPLSLITIGIAWISYRPILAVSLIAIGGGAAFFLIKKKKSSVKSINKTVSSSQLKAAPSLEQNEKEQNTPQGPISEIPDLPAASASEANYFVYLGDKQYGPFTVDKIESYLSEGKVQLSTPCSDVNGQYKMSVAEIPGIRKSA